MTIWNQKENNKCLLLLITVYIPPAKLYIQTKDDLDPFSHPKSDWTWKTKKKVETTKQYTFRTVA